jgi:AAHS family benzoate transporter-like MFS transporter
MSTSRIARGFNPAVLWVIVLCWVTITLDGYDLIVYGAIVPALLRDSTFGPLTPAQAGAIGSYALVGMLLGALAVGTLTDLIGRRRIVLLCVTWFSLAMGLSALAPSPGLLGVFRFLAGLGLGGVVPTASALTIEYAPRNRKDLTYAIMFSGYSIGGMVAASLGIGLIPVFGWRVMFALGLLGLVLVLPLTARFLPESLSFLVARGRLEEARAVAARFHLHLDDVPLSTPKHLELADSRRGKLAALATLFSPAYLAATLLFWVATFLGLLLVYGLNTWLPEIMRREGYALGSVLGFLLALNVGAIVGTLVAAAAADRVGSKVICTLAFLSAALSIFLLSLRPSELGIYVLVAVAGLGSVGTQILVNSYVAKHYPVQSRATALGWSLGIGRLGAITGPLLGGFVLSSSLGLEWNYYVFVATGLLGVLIVLLVPRAPTVRGREPASVGAGAGPVESVLAGTAASGRAQ